MNDNISLRVRAAASAALVAATLSSQLCAGTPDSPSLQINPKLGPAHVLYDEPGDGAVWALGVKYKASFGPDGAVFIPAFGSSAPQNYPHALSPDSVTVGGIPLTFTRSVKSERDGNRIEFQRGSFVERYDLVPESMEQSFVFQSLPRTGDLVVHIPINSELAGAEVERGLEFASDFGTLTYSRAVAIDARGLRIEAPTELVDGAIVITVGAEFLARATLPLIIDPVVGTLYANLDSDDLRQADAAWDAFNGVWLITWSKAFSATDNDVLGRTVSPFGFTDSLIDVTGASWSTPRCAYLASVHQFLVVAAVNSTTIQGRTLLPSGAVNVLGSQFSISGPDGGAKSNPDVGGDAVSNSTSSYCVVWQRLDPINGTYQIASRLVASTSVPAGTNAVYLTASHPFWSSVLPTVSKSSNGTEWLIAYTFEDPVTRSDTWAARIGTNGTLISPSFQVTAGLGWETQPVASSFQTGTSRAVIAYKYRTTATGQNDIWVAVLDGATVVGGANITALENSGFQSRDQIDPAVDCDGQHFLIAYSEFDPNFVTWDVHATDIGLAGNTVVLTQSHIPVQPYGLSEYRSQVAAARNTNGTDSRRYCVSWDFRENDADYDVIFKTFDSFEGGNSGLFCFGDGTGTACPCGNNGLATHGCANSSGPAGAWLLMTGGTASTVNDTATIAVGVLPSGTFCLLFQGTVADAGSVFSDGLLCATGTITRLTVKAATGTSAVFPSGAEPPLSVAGGVPLNGGMRTYQVWYRDAATFCTAATSNLSNGLYINWAR
ncbi:MAG: hypothetical protein JNL28_06445 [Planctomycetes bacterium]|nr:hypothetical protein [Planctomycetota bacterium]